MTFRNRRSDPGIIIIIGLDGGVGQALASELALHGYEVRGTVRQVSDVERCGGAVSSPVAVDLCDSASLAQAVSDLTSAAGARLAGIVVCAGVSDSGVLELCPAETLRRTLEVNCVANLVIYQAGISALRASRGRLVLIGSYAGAVALPGFGPYVASKHALEGLCDVMRREANPWGVHISLIRPGGIRTGMVDLALRELERQRAALNPVQTRLHGPVYDGVLGLARAGARHGLAPAVVARRVRQALQSRRPKARYAVGRDAIGLLLMRKWLPDRLMDQALRRAYGAARPRTPSALQTTLETSV